MKDRIAAHPGRVKLTPVSGNIYDMEMADDPVEAGTALNKANLLTDATAAAVNAEYGSTPDTPSEALGIIANGKVGTIVRSIDTDLGVNYALCNGDMYDPTEYPALAAILPKNVYPKDNPNWELAYDGREEGYCYLTELFNGNFAQANSSPTFQVVDKKGSPIASVTAQDMTANSNARLWYMEHNGSKYICFIYPGNPHTTLEIYSTTDFSTYTLENTITELASYSYRSEADLACGNFDGTYYYFVREGIVSSVQGEWVAVIDSNFNLVSDTFVPTRNFRIRMCGNRAYAVWHDTSTTPIKIGFKELNGAAPPTSISGYRTAEWASSMNFTYFHIEEFNDDYDIAWVYNYGYVVFIPRDGTSAPISVAIPASAGTAMRMAYLDGTNEKFIVGGSGGTVYCDTTAADPSQASAWHDLSASSASWGYMYDCHYRSKAGVLLSRKQILRANLLPQISETECYNYIKIQ